MQSRIGGLPVPTRLVRCQGGGTDCTDAADAHMVDADGNVLHTFRADDGGDGYVSEIEIRRGDRPGRTKTTPAPVSSTASATKSPSSPRTLIESAINGVELPDYAGVPDFVAPA